MKSLYLFLSLAIVAIHCSSCRLPNETDSEEESNSDTEDLLNTGFLFESDDESQELSEFLQVTEGFAITPDNNTIFDIGSTIFESGDSGIQDSDDEEDKIEIKNTLKRLDAFSRNFPNLLNDEEGK